MTRRLTFIILLLLLFWVGASYLQFSVFRLLMIALILLVAASFVHPVSYTHLDVYKRQL